LLIVHLIKRRTLLHAVFACASSHVGIQALLSRTISITFRHPTKQWDNSTSAAPPPCQGAQ